ncbi:hypothetical protein BLS_008476 [Venturia inaequalis]|uniref:Cytochrome P450 n=1 Tax=Venturia inaequalis TaxID=5025 RepID=A0A8H3V1E6_VENIN|nr:hypothetical protein BLS_008476 [Venturia inaequalis]
MTYTLIAAVLLPVQICLSLLNFVYNIFLHPLRSYPGPWYARISRLWYINRAFTGTLPCDIKKLHDQYGPVVRIAPNELSYNHPGAWQAIYGSNASSETGLKQLFRKDPVFYASFLDKQDTMIDAEDESHRDQKKPLSYRFSHRAIVSTQDILTKYHLLMIQKLKQYMASHNEPIDMNVWVPNCVLDISSMLAISRDHGATACSAKAHPFLPTLSKSIDFLWFYVQFQRLPRPITWIMQQITAFVFGHFKLFERNNISSLIKDRLNNGSTRPDYVTQLLMMTEYANGVKDTSLIPKATLLIIGGTETTSTVLLGLIYHLTANPKTYRIAAQEVRSTFNDVSDISIESTRDLRYLSVCIDESLRMYTSFPGALPRLVPPGGAAILGRHVPENTVVGIPHYAAFRSGQNFSNPDDFLPERSSFWLRSRVKSEAHPYHGQERRFGFDGAFFGVIEFLEVESE